MQLDANLNNRDEKTVTITMSGHENHFITVILCHRANSRNLKTECSAA